MYARPQVCIYRSDLSRLLYVYACQDKSNAHFLRRMAKKDKRLTEAADFVRLRKKYFHHRAKWRSIGCFLEISQSDLEVIDIDGHGKCDDCFRAVILQWLRNHKKPQESQLRQAVEDAKNIPAQGHGELQQKVEMTITMIHAQDHGELQQKEEKSKKTTIENLAAPIIFTAIAILLAIVVLTPPTPLPTGTVSGPSNYTSYSLFNATVENLKVLYREHRVMEFNAVDDVPFLNVSLRHSDSSVIEFWQLFQDTDIYYKNLQDSNLNNRQAVRVMITGHPGAGKTTLMRHLAKEWAEGRALQSCQIFFLVHLDRLSKSMEFSPRSLKDVMMKSQYIDLKNIMQISEYIVEKDGAGTCFLLDSYDQWKFKQEKDFLHELFFEEKLHLSLCILTTRSPPFETSKQGSSHNFEIVGFNHKHLDMYLHNVTSDTYITGFVEKSWEDHNTKELCEIPLHMMMLIYIAKHRGNVMVHTKTQLYIAFMNVIIEQFSLDPSDWDKHDLKQCILHRESNIHDDMCAAFHNLTYVAYEATFNNSVPKISKTIRNSIDRLSIVKVESKYEKVNYIFSHDTFTEFYAAVFLLSLPVEHLLYLFVKNKNKYFENRAVWVFLFGLLGEDYSANLTVSAAMRHFLTMEPMFQMKFSEVTKLIPEIGWTGERLNNLLESVGLMENYTTCSSTEDQRYLEFLLNHATVHTLTITGSVSTIIKIHGNIHVILFGSNLKMIFNKGNSLREGLDYQTIEAAFNCVTQIDLYIKCEKSIKSWPSPTLTHLDLHDFGEYSEFEGIIHCVATSIGANLQSLILDSAVLGVNSNIIIPPLSKLLHLQTLQLRDLQSAVTVSNLNQLPSTLKLDLEISYSSLQLLEKLKNLSRLECLTIRINDSSQDHSLDPIDMATYSKLTGLKRLSVEVYGNTTTCNFSRVYGHKTNFCSKIVDQILTSQKSKPIETLEIDGCHIGTHAMKLLKLTKLPQTLLHVNLINGNLTDEDMPLLAESLKDMHRLTSLSLRSNGITGTGLRSLVDALKPHKNFVELDISDNPISVNNGLETLAKLTNLRDLKLRNSSITTEALGTLVNAKDFNFKLNSLDLSYNPFLHNTDGFRLLSRFKSIRQLNTRGWLFHKESLIDVLKNLTQLRSLKLCDYSLAYNFGEDMDYDEESDMDNDEDVEESDMDNDEDVEESDMDDDEDVDFTADYSNWSIDLAKAISDLPELQTLEAPCLYSRMWNL